MQALIIFGVFRFIWKPTYGFSGPLTPLACRHMIRFEIIHFSIESSYKTYAYLADLFEAEKFCTVLANMLLKFCYLFYN